MRLLRRALAAVSDVAKVTAGAVVFSLLIFVGCAYAAVPGHPISNGPCASLGEGNDLSSYQGTVNFKQLATRSLLGWIKVGGWESGGPYRDRGYSVNATNAAFAGWPNGPYFYAKPIASPVAEADYAVSIGFRDNGGPPPMLDFEESAGLSGPQLDAWALSFLREATRLTGDIDAVYTGAWIGTGGSYFGNDPALAQYPLVVASYGYNMPNSSPCNRSWPYVPNAWARVGFTAWQHNSTSYSPGISVVVDQDVIDPAAVRAWTGAHVAPNPAPTNDPAAAGNASIGQGAHGDKVEAIQRVVGARVDGDYGPATARAVASFQSKFGLPTTGVWDARTQAAADAFYAWLARLPHIPPTVCPGARGSTVVLLQSNLVRHGYWLKVDAVDGVGTTGAVRWWQATHRLFVDGCAGPATWPSVLA